MITRRKRSILEMAVATACFGAAAVAAAMPVTALAAPQNGNAQTSVQQKKTKKEVANEKLLPIVVVNGFISSIANSIAIQKNSNSIVEAVSAEQIGKLPGSSIADSLSRLPGVAVQTFNGRPQDVSIHGLGPDFSSTLLDGTLQPSTGNNRGVQFDQYPASWFNAIVVHLTPTADLLGQGLAGTVDMQTVRPLDEKGPKATINGYYTWLGSGAKLMPGPGVSNQGHDINGIFTDQFFDHTFGVNLGIDLETYPAHINHQGPWGYPTDANNNYVIGGSKNYNISDLLKRNGYLATFEYRPSSSYTSTLDLTYSNSNETQQAKGIEFPLKWSSATLASATPVNGFDQSGQYTGVYPVIRNDYQHFKSYVYNALWRNHFKLSHSWTADFNATYSRAESEDTLLESYSGFGYDGPANSATVPPSTVNFYEAPTGELVLNSPQNFNSPSIVLTDPQGWGGGPNNGKLVQAGFINAPHTEDYLANFKLAAQHYFARGPISSMEIGVARTSRKKNYHISQNFLSLPGAACGEIFSATCTPTETAPIPASALEPATNALGFMGIGPQVLYNPLALIASGALVEVPTFMSSLPIPPNWLVKENDTDGFVQFNIDTSLTSEIGLRGNFGVQIAHTSQGAYGEAPVPNSSTGGAGVPSLIPVSGGTSYTRVLPSLNLVFSLPYNNDVRLGVARTMVRPRMDQINAGNVVSYNTTNLTSTSISNAALSEQGGNPELKPYMATNYNFSAEHYFKGPASGYSCNGSDKNSPLCSNGTGYVQFAAYYLSLSDYVNQNTAFVKNFAPYVADFPINQALLGTTYGYFSYPSNDGHGHLEGLQLATNIPLGDFTHWLNGFGILASANRNISHVVYADDPTSIQQIDGQSEWVQDYTAYFQYSGFQARVSDEIRSTFLGRVFGISASRTEADIRGYSEIDAQLSYGFDSGKLNGLTLIATGSNLGHHGTKVIQNGDPRQVLLWEQYPSTYQVGFSYDFQ